MNMEKAHAMTLNALYHRLLAALLDAMQIGSGCMTSALSLFLLFDAFAQVQIFCIHSIHGHELFTNECWTLLCLCVSSKE